MLELDYGEKLNFTDPRFPTSTTKEFTQTILRDIASGLLVQYPSLANDLEGVNFSSIRAGLVDERDMWRVIQAWFITDFLEPIYFAWLRMALLTTLKDITLTADQIEMVEWRPRGWEWVDPLKDADATVLKLGNGLSTYTKELGAQGMSFEDTMDDRAREQKYVEDLQARFKLRNPVVLGTDLAGDQAGKGVAPGAEDEVQADAKAGAGDTSDVNSGGKGKGGAKT
jgi:lambda family phage portal protein